MKKDKTVASRLPEDLLRDLELMERVEQTDRATAVRKLLARALEEWKLDFFARPGSHRARAAEQLSPAQPRPHPVPGYPSRFPAPPRCSLRTRLVP